MKLKLYSDISHYREAGVFGWCWLLSENNKVVEGPVTGVSPDKWPEGSSMEGYPVKLALANLKPEVQVICDHATKISGLRSTRPEKNDPCYLLCHYAAQSSALKHMRKEGL